MQLMAEGAKCRNVFKLKENKYFGVPADKTADNQNDSVFSIICRTVNEKLEADEIFSGTHVVPSKKSETLSNALVARSFL